MNRLFKRRSAARPNPASRSKFTRNRTSPDLGAEAKRASRSGAFDMNRHSTLSPSRRRRTRWEGAGSGGSMAHPSISTEPEEGQCQCEKYCRAQRSLSTTPRECAGAEGGFHVGRRNLERTFGRGYLRGILLMILFTGAIMLGSLPASAQDLPPLRDDLQNLKNMPWGPQRDFSFPPYATLGADPFEVIAPYLDGLQSLAQLGLVQIPEDATALSDFLNLALRARLQELGIENEIQVRPLAPPLSPNVEDLADCSTLGMAVTFATRDAVHDGRSVVVVVARTVLWQLRPQSGLGRSSSTCSSNKATEPGPVEVFLVEPGERETTLALAKDALLSIIDHAILYRLVLTNSGARERVKSWVIK